MSQRALIITAIAVTVLAFVAAEADFVGEYDSLRHQTYKSTLLTSFRIAWEGDIELDSEQAEIVRMSPDAVLEVRQRRFTSRKKLEVRPDADGRPVYSYKVGARKRPAEEGKAYLDTVMDSIVRSTTVGAHARARRLLDEEGLDALLYEVGGLRSNSARRIYLEAAAEMESLDETQARRIVETAGREISSSSRLRATLVDLSERWPVDWQLNQAFTEAAEEIASSSEKRHTLVEVARHRGIGDDADSFAEVASTIGAGSEKARAVSSLHEIEPTPEVAMALLETVDTIASSGERRRALTELVARPELPEEVYSRAFEVVHGISASSERATALTAMAPFLASARGPGDARPEVVEDTERADDAEPVDDAEAVAEVAGELVEEAADLEAAPETPPAAAGVAFTDSALSDTLGREYIQAASSISASSELRRAFLALSRASDLSEPLCDEWIESSSRVASTSIAADLLIESARVCPGSDRLWKAYLSGVGDLQASSEQRRALMALLERGDLSGPTLDGLERAAEKNIASTSEREAVIERVEEVRVAHGS